MTFKKYPFYKQHDQMDCGPTCLRMIAKYYGRSYKLQTLIRLSEINMSGISLLGLSNAAEAIGFRTMGVKVELALLKDLEMPCILHWRQNHYVVLYKIKGKNYHIADPSQALLTFNEDEFLRNWASDASGKEGYALTLAPSPAFYEETYEKFQGVKWAYIIRYLAKYKNLIVQLFFGLGIGTLLQLVVPFLTQSIVDVGINTRNINFITVILIAQTALIVGRLSVDFIRSWIMLHVSTRINISILTDFLIKLMKLPMSYFDTKMTGDIMQRMNDQRQIESFLTGSALNTIFSVLNLIIFSVVLIFYNTTIFTVVAISSVVFAAWFTAFLKQRRSLNYKNFEVSSKNQSAVIQLVSGMQEIKLNNCEQQKRWEWEHIQARLFKFNVRSLALNQYQQAGATFINEGRNILITFISAKAVIDGSLSLGGMMAVQYIVGQVSSPISSLIGFFQSFQDAKISLERLNEIHEMEDEEPLEKELSHFLPENKSISINKLSFAYPGANDSFVLKNIDLLIQEGKTTAIVGMSGSGKSTILKLLLRFYFPSTGDMKIGDQSINNISFKTWRKEFGVVMQDGFIFSDTIERNIAVGEEVPNREKLLNAIKVANIESFVTSLPLGIRTKIGTEGNGISQGQKQRILIARAVYKDPHYILFDEATNALDANNEMVIMENLQSFFSGRTVVVVAHRLSTVKNADNIIVLNNGIITEQGSHAYLTEIKGEYYQLVKNQLELGN